MAARQFFRRRARAAVGCTGTFFAFVNPMRFVHFLRRVMLHVGWRFFLLLVCINMGVKGLVDGLTRRSLLPYLKLLNQDAATYQRVDALGSSVWGCRGVIGAVSDCVPLGGYHKRYYMLLSNVLGVVGLALLVCLPVAYAQNHMWSVGLAEVLLCVGIATLEVMCAGKTSEIMAENPEVKGDLISFSFACASIGSLVGCSLVGPISDGMGPQVVYLVAIPFMLQPLLPTMLGYMREQKKTGWVLPRERLHSHKGIFIMTLLIALSVFGIIAITISGYLKAMVPYCLVLIPILISASFAFLPRTMASCNVCMFLWGVSNVSISGALDFFYTASPKCLPDGPHFDYTYYSTYTALTGTVAEWLGIWFFHEFLSGWTFRYVFWLTSAIRTLASLFDYMMVRRVNLLIGVPDKVMYLMGDAIIQRLVITLNFLPALILTSKLCPRGMEATAYAVMDGMAHLGWNINKQIGAWAIELAGIRATGNADEPCNFDNLGTLTLITQVLLPSLVVPLSFCMIPNVPVSANLVPSGSEDSAGDSGSSEAMQIRSDSAFAAPQSSGEESGPAVASTSTPSSTEKEQETCEPPHTDGADDVSRVEIIELPERLRGAEEELAVQLGHA